MGDILGASCHGIRQKQCAFIPHSWLFSMDHRGWKGENYNSQIGSRLLDVNLLSTRYSCVRTGTWNKSRNHFRVFLTAAERCMDGSRHEVIPYQPSTCVQQGSCVSQRKSERKVTLCDPMDYSLPGSSIHGIFQAIVLEWIAISSGSSGPRDGTQVSRRFTIWATREANGNILWFSNLGSSRSFSLSWTRASVVDLKIMVFYLPCLLLFQSFQWFYIHLFLIL